MARVVALEGRYERKCRRRHLHQVVHQDTGRETLHATDSRARLSLKHVRHALDLQAAHPSPFRRNTPRSGQHAKRMREQIAGLACDSHHVDEPDRWSGVFVGDRELRRLSENPHGISDRGPQFRANEHPRLIILPVDDRVAGCVAPFGMGEPWASR